MATPDQTFTDARETRLATLALVDGLDQAASERRPAPEKWSVGEVLDHLLKADAIVVGEIDVAIRQRKNGMVFVYRSLADVDASVPWVLKPFLPLVELPLGLAGTLVPPPVRRFLTGNRRVRGQAPPILWPRFGRPIETLRAELAETFETLERQRAGAGVDLARLYYFNPIVGLTAIPGLYRFVAGHEQRHQEQLREILASA